jgi:hypothetical protein
MSGMSDAEFETQYLRLLSEWPKSYGTEKKALLYKAFMDKPAHVLRKCISEAMKRARGAPTVQEIEAALSSCPRTLDDDEFRNCPTCGGSGLYIPKTDKRGVPTAYPCPRHGRKVG